MSREEREKKKINFEKKKICNTITLCNVDCVQNKIFVKHHFMLLAHYTKKRLRERLNIPSIYLCVCLSCVGYIPSDEMTRLL
ncbi:Uncharacterized protein APZ42_033234 [Daphnia magna]|uniref:Uncharacterized protein n=1 Tax=Daphnia magna TaxID=35525 RepID=A0A164L960_9CRUS|nr:Uncharacterized protein APZ42_033234 [Daphnia magna]